MGAESIGYKFDDELVLEDHAPLYFLTRVNLKLLHGGL
ncbi:hypothetical protein Pse7367_0587 [Thalassoporum mexicanum PCC 7367]|nr:hypothetical protein Pse7367_0587 [Pseudanabaena sp. PCC 7367]